MATKRRKCDIPTAGKAPPPGMEVCPICGLLPSDREKNGCSFFNRCRSLKFAGGPKSSAVARSEHFRRFHADFCPTCRLPKDVCHDKKITRIKSRRTKEGDSYISGQEMRDLLSREPCRTKPKSPDGRFTPVKPDWYVEEASPLPPQES